METIRFGEGGSSGGGSLVHHTGTAPAPAVVLLTAIAGINPYMERVAGQLAEHGFTTLVLDYYARSGQVPDLSSPEKIMAAVGALSDPQTLGDLQDAVHYLAELETVNPERVAVLGFCVGGTYALMATSRVDGLRATAAFYGVLSYAKLSENKPLSPLDAVEASRVPLLAHYGDEDHLVPVTDVEALRERTRGAPAEVYLYPGAGHAFHEDFRPDIYRPVAARLAWTRTLAHLDWHLGSADGTS